MAKNDSSQKETQLEKKARESNKAYDLEKYDAIYEKRAKCNASMNRLDGLAEILSDKTHLQYENTLNKMISKEDYEDYKAVNSIGPQYKLKTHQELALEEVVKQKKHIEHNLLPGLDNQEAKVDRLVDDPKASKNAKKEAALKFSKEPTVKTIEEKVQKNSKKTQ